ncbi:hypothetical protein [[Eubacterium] cellulosolvens]
MISKLVEKSLVVLIVFLILFMNFFGLSFSDSQTLLRSQNNQPDNSFKKYLWGGICDQQNAGYGWNITYINNFNGDSYPELVVSAPYYDKDLLVDCGAVFIFYGSANKGFNNINYSEADIMIYGGNTGENFGWDVADAGDMNGDGLNELIVGSPSAQNNQGRAYIFYGGSLSSGSYSASANANRILPGLSVGGLYGSAVSGIGDIDNDGYDDVLVGAPGTDEAVISYGYAELIRIYPDIWDDDPGTPGILDFSKGANNTVNDINTWGRLAGDDGWDWIDAINDTADRVYGHHVTTPAHGTTIDLADCYGPWEPNGGDGDNLTRDNRSALQVIAGRTRLTSNPYGPTGSNDPMTSAAWGIEFNITFEMMEYINTNSTIIVSFNYESWDNEKVFNSGTTAGTEEICTVRSRLWNSTGKYYLGNIIKNNERYIFYHYQEYGTPEWATVTDSFEYDISEFIDGPGSYYWDFGCSFGSSDINQNNNDPDEGILTYFDDVSMVITNERNVLIEGAHSSGFGSALAGVGDINGDNYADVLIGAPRLDTGYAVLLHGKKHFKAVEPMSIATVILAGKEDGDRFGYSLASDGDVDNDGLQDIIIGAPGGGYANLYFGRTLNTPALLPDLWENDLEKATPQIEFDSGFKTTGNTPGLDGEDDGWDIWNGVYGYSGGNPGSSVEYNGANSPNPTQVAIDDKLLIGIGAHFGNDAEPDSGAYGVEFLVTQDMPAAIQLGGEAVISYDWYFENLELENDETIWMKTYLRAPTSDFDLGWDLDSQASSNNKDQSQEIYWSDSPADMHDVFVQQCSECFTNSGSYYLDIGGKIRSWTSNPTNIEDGIFHFDNIQLRINHPPDIQFIGPPESGFGFSTGYPNKLNFDDYGDVIISAPFYDSPNGLGSGAIFGFYSLSNGEKQIMAEHADYVMYGEHGGDNFGWALGGKNSLDSDEYTEIITSAVGYDSGTTIKNVGKVYLLSITKNPRIRLLYPLSGEFLNGSVTVNATVTDPDNNLDISYGVRFYYSTGLTNWTQIGIDNTQTAQSNIYEHNWNTSMVPDSTDYYLKAWVRDLELNTGENISTKITIDNPHPPTITFITPKLGETISGSAVINARVMDSELDQIGGGINKSDGVKFYISKNQTIWDLLGVIKTGAQDLYTIELATEEYMDGEYWLRVNASDLDGMEVSKIINFTIENPPRPPSVELLAPLGELELKGLTEVSAVAFDFDNDINASGVSFFVSPSDAPEQWQYIGNDPSPTINSTGAHVYSIDWDTTSVTDSWYQLRAYVMDNMNLTNESISPEIRIHNNEKNAPEIEIVSPVGGEEVKETLIIITKVRDLENNIDSHGVDFYYSSDRVQWRFIGTSTNPRDTNKDYYDFLWQTSTVPDGEYWLNVTVADDTNLKSWDISNAPIFLHNSKSNPPVIKILAPQRGQHINGTFMVQVSALDLENNIDSIGVVFQYSPDGDDWTVISNSPSPTEPEGNIYELTWDTMTIPDGKYWLKAEATDFDRLTGFAISDYFYIHNKFENPPVVRYLGPNSGNVTGVVKLNATVFDLDENIDNDGVKFYYSMDNQTWHQISNDPSGSPVGEGILYYEISWDTNMVPDDFYWLRAAAQDLTGLIGMDQSNQRIIVHNRLTNPPRITFKQPKSDVPLPRIVSIIVEVIDFEDDVESVSFYYSSDNITWKLIDSRLKPDINKVYKTIWNTENILNGEYYIKVMAKDKLGNQVELLEGPFSVKEGKESEGRTEAEFPSWIVIIIIIIVIMLMMIFLFHRHTKRREKELIEEVSAELRGSKVSDEDVDITARSEVLDSEGAQTYIPAPEMASSELSVSGPAKTGQISPEENVTEEMVSKPEPAPAEPRDVSLEPESGAPASLETTPELPAIDDILPQLLPSAESTPTQEPPAETEAPADVELPPEIELPPEEPASVPTAESAPVPELSQQEQTETTTEEAKKREPEPEE